MVIASGRHTHSAIHGSFVQQVDATRMRRKSKKQQARGKEQPSVGIDMGREDCAYLLYLLIQLNSSRTHTQNIDGDNNVTQQSISIEGIYFLPHTQMATETTTTKKKSNLWWFSIESRQMKNTHYMTFSATSVNHGVIYYDVMMWTAYTPHRQQKGQIEPRHTHITHKVIFITLPYKCMHKILCGTRSSNTSHFYHLSQLVKLFANISAICCRHDIFSTADAFFIFNSIVSHTQTDRTNKTGITVMPNRVRFQKGFWNGVNK